MGHENRVSLLLSVLAKNHDLGFEEVAEKSKRNRKNKRYYLNLKVQLSRKIGPAEQDQNIDPRDEDSGSPYNSSHKLQPILPTHPSGY